MTIDSISSANIIFAIVPYWLSFNIEADKSEKLAIEEERAVGDVSTFLSTQVRRLTLVSCLATLTSLSLSPQTSRRFARAEEAGETTISCQSAFVRLRWAGQVYISVESNQTKSPVICMSNKDGLVSRRSFEIPGAAYIFIYDITAAYNGVIALVGTAVSSDSKAGTFVARIEPGNEAVISRVTPYVPRKIAIAADGTLWTVGWMKTETGAEGENNVLKRFDAKGKGMGTMLPRPRFRKGLPASVDTPDYSVLRASNDRLAWLTAGNEYIEWSLDGRTLTRIEGPPLTERHYEPVCLALSDDAQVIASSQSVVDLEKWDVWVLNRATRAWRPIEIIQGPLPRWGRLLGFDGDILVTGFTDGKVLRFKRQVDEAP